MTEKRREQKRREQKRREERRERKSASIGLLFNARICFLCFSLLRPRHSASSWRFSLERSLRLLSPVKKKREEKRGVGEARKRGEKLERVVVGRARAPVPFLALRCSVSLFSFFPRREQRQLCSALLARGGEIGERVKRVWNARRGSRFGRASSIVEKEAAKRKKTFARFARRAALPPTSTSTARKKLNLPLLPPNQKKKPLQASSRWQAPPRREASPLRSRPSATASASRTGNTGE